MRDMKEYDLRKFTINDVKDVQKFLDFNAYGMRRMRELMSKLVMSNNAYKNMIRSYERELDRYKVADRSAGVYSADGSAEGSVIEEVIPAKEEKIEGISMTEDDVLAYVSGEKEIEKGEIDVPAQDEDEVSEGEDIKEEYIKEEDIKEEDTKEEVGGDSSYDAEAIDEMNLGELKKASAVVAPGEERFTGNTIQFPGLTDEELEKMIVDINGHVVDRAMNTEGLWSGLKDELGYVGQFNTRTGRIVSRGLDNRMIAWDKIPESSKEFFEKNRKVLAEISLRKAKRPNLEMLGKMFGEEYLEEIFARQED